MNVHKLSVIFAILIILVGIPLVSPTAKAAEAKCISNSPDEVLTDKIYLQDSTLSAHYIDNQNKSETLCDLHTSFSSPSGVSSSDLSILEKGIILADPGGEVIIREKSDFNPINSKEEEVYYEGAIIGTSEFDSAILEDGKDVTIRGESDGIVAIQPNSRSKSVSSIEEAPIVLSDNEHQKVKLKNVILGHPQMGGADRAAHVKSRSHLLLERVTMDKSLNSSLSSRSHILVENSLSLDVPTGSIIETKDVYYGSSNPSSQLQPNEIIASEPDLTVNPDNVPESRTDDFIFNQITNPSNFNKVVNGNYGPIIRVNNKDGSNNMISNEFENVSAATRAARPNTQIKIEKTGTPYTEDITISGSFVSSSQKISLKGENGVPSIGDISLSYAGDYNLEDVSISSVTVTDNRVSLRADEVYWQGTNPSSTTSSKIERLNIDDSEAEESDILVTPWKKNPDKDSQLLYDDNPYCIKSDSSNLTLADGSPSVNCNSGDRADITLSIQYDSTSDKKSDLRSGSYYVEANNVQEEFDFRFSVFQSDSNIQSSETLLKGQNIESGSFVSLFSRSTSQSRSDQINVQPAGEIIIDGEDSGIFKTSYSLNNLLNFNTTTTEQNTGRTNSPDFPGDNTSIVGDEFNRRIQYQKTMVSRFNGGESDSPFEKNNIPPFSQTSAGYKSSATGLVKDFENSRIPNGRPAILRPTDELLNVGFSVQNLPPAQNHYLNLSYSYQAPSSKNVSVEITDAVGNIIYKGRDKSELRLPSTTNLSSSFLDGEVESRNVVIPLHQLETKSIKDTEDIYFKIKENGVYVENTTFFLFKASIISTDNPGRFDSLPNSPGNQNPVEGSLLTEIEVPDRDLNEKYDTYDIAPGEDLKYQILLQNTGEETVSGDFVVRDNGLSTETLTSTLSAGESASFKREISWSETETGLHRIRLSRSDGNIGSTVGFDVYVLKPPQPEVVEIDVPEEHITHDNFNARVKIRNRGDLSGETLVTSTFGSWQDKSMIELPPGDSRQDKTSENSTISYLRSDHPDMELYPNFGRREYTLSDDVVKTGQSFENPTGGDYVEFPVGSNSSVEANHPHYRPNSPFHTKTGLTEFVTKVNASGKITKESDTVKLYQLQVDDFYVDTHPSQTGNISNKPNYSEAEVYASAWPYSQPSRGGPTAMIPNSQNYSVKGGYGTLFAYNKPGQDAVNRGSFPLNEPGINLTSESGLPLGSAFSHMARSCNDNLLYSGNNFQKPADENTVADVVNSFVPFSADGCKDEDRFTRIQAMRFVGTANDTVTDTNASSPSSSKTVKGLPSDVQINGTDPQDFRDIDSEGSAMFAHVRITNPGDSEYMTTGRVEIVTDKSPDAGIGAGSPNFDDNVIGAAAVRLRPTETRIIRVPIAVRNINDSEGVNNISVRVHSMSLDDEEDYISDQGIRNGNEYLSPITGVVHDRATIPINVSTYGDAILKELKLASSVPNTTSPSNPQDAIEADGYAFSVCRDNSKHLDHRANVSLNDSTRTFTPDLTEGLSPESATRLEGFVRSLGQCNTGVTDQDETVTVKSTYENYGGEPVDINPNLLAEKVTRGYQTEMHRNSSHATGDRYVANYSSGGQFDGIIDPKIEVNGTSLGVGQSFQLNPGESKTVTFERKFQEPGLYQLRASPCREVSPDGPQDYNLEGLTGIVDSTSTASGMTTNYLLSKTDINRSNGNYNTYTTNETQSSVYHSSYGCANKLTSVFVFDTTNPVADFRLAEDLSAVKKASDSSYEQTLSRQTPDSTNVRPLRRNDSGYAKDDTLTVYKGGLLMFDASSFDCNKCYNGNGGITGSNVVKPGRRTDNGFLKNSVISSSGGPGNVSGLPQYPLSQVNTQISDMSWSIGGGTPNFGSGSSLCTPGGGNPYNHCYLETFSGDSSGEVIAHRFNGGSTEVSLNVFDERRLTQGDPNENKTTKDINVKQNTRIDDVSLLAYQRYDLDYGIPGFEEQVEVKGGDIVLVSDCGSPSTTKEVDVAEDEYISDVESFYVEFGLTPTGRVDCSLIEDAGSSDSRLQIADDGRDSKNATIEAFGSVPNSVQLTAKYETKVDRGCTNPASGTLGAAADCEIWERENKVVGGYRNPVNHLSSPYNNVFEGTRVCLQSEVGPEEIGVSEDEWNGLKNGNTHIIARNSNGFDVSNGFADEPVSKKGAGQIESGTNLGDRRCLVFRDNDNDETQRFTYKATDFKPSTEDSSVEVNDRVSDKPPETIANQYTANKRYHDEFSNPISKDQVFAANPDTDFSGGYIGMASGAKSRGQDIIGISCLDVRLKPTDNRCQTVDGTINSTSAVNQSSSKGVKQEVSGLLKSASSGGGINLDGSIINKFYPTPDSLDDTNPNGTYYSDAFTAEQLGIVHDKEYVSPAFPNKMLSPGFNSIKFRSVASDWHGNHDTSDTTETRVAVDGESPEITRWSVSEDKAWVGGKGSYSGTRVNYTAEGEEQESSVIQQPVGFYQARPGWGDSSMNTTIEKGKGNADTVVAGTVGAGESAPMFGGVRGEKVIREISKSETAKNWGYKYNTFNSPTNSKTNTVEYVIEMEDLHENVDSKTVSVDWRTNQKDPEISGHEATCSTNYMETNLCYLAAPGFAGGEISLSYNAGTNSGSIAGEKVPLYRRYSQIGPVKVGGKSSGETNPFPKNSYSFSKNFSAKSLGFDIGTYDTQDVNFTTEIEGQHGNINNESDRLGLVEDNTNPVVSLNPDNPPIVTRTFGDGDSPSGTIQERLSASVNPRFTSVYNVSSTAGSLTKSPSGGLSGSWSSQQSFQLELSVTPSFNVVPPTPSGFQCGGSNGFDSRTNSTTKIYDFSPVLNATDYHGNTGSDSSNVEFQVTDTETEKVPCYKGVTYGAGIGNVSGTITIPVELDSSQESNYSVTVTSASASSVSDATASGSGNSVIVRHSGSDCSSGTVRFDYRVKHDASGELIFRTGNSVQVDFTVNGPC